MTRYYSDEIKWRTLQARLGSFINYDLHYGAMTKIFEHIDETERYILQSEFWHLYTKVDKYYDANIATKILHAFESTEVVLEQNIHKKTLASIDSKGCDLATKALTLLNQVNSGKNVYESKHITVQEIKSGTRGMNDYGTTKSITRPMTADELMRLDYAPLNNVRDDFKARLEQLQEDPSLLGEELSVEQLQALQNMTIQDMMGYTGDFGEYIMVLSDRAQRWSFWEPFIDVTISIASIALAGATLGLSIGVAAAYFTAKAAWYISNDTNMLTGLPLTNGDKGWLIFDAIASMFAATAGFKLLQTGSKVPSTVMKAITATDKALNVLELSIAAGTGLYALQNQQYGTSIVMLGLVAFGAKGLKGSGDYSLGVVRKEGNEVIGRYSPINPGPLNEQIATSFRGASYSETVLEVDTVLYRVHGGSSGKVGSYVSKTPQGGGLQSQLDLALNPSWGNTTENVTKAVVPKGTTIYEGSAAPQTIVDSLGNRIGMLPGGGNQIYIPEVNAGWFK